MKLKNYICLNILSILGNFGLIISFLFLVTALNYDGINDIYGYFLVEHCFSYILIILLFYVLFIIELLIRRLKKYKQLIDINTRNLTLNYIYNIFFYLGLLFSILVLLFYIIFLFFS